jgi:hypothetical protein
MPELPRLNDLVWFAYPAAYDANGVLKRNARDRRVKQQSDKVECLGLFRLFVFEPSRAANG